MQETQEARVRSLGQEDLLEKEVATHSSILAWKIPWTEEPAGLQSMEWWRVKHDWATQHTQIHTVGMEGKQRVELLWNGGHLASPGE